ncbi:alcohol dehydrogenase catalytic domain-containing protein [Parafrankia elaeagni]|uniref:alcohol dehydrogenase catalytic domain-containing protein n=1 Tax=Parafrankia elaeagni TaxID=222534 RepID=UPI0003A4C8CE|nr:alcohol dehydrogenase catalytic domain-containing protein [Parafrankia elaeagni]
MRAAVLRGGTVETRVISDPVPGPGQLLVRSLACGICASDIHFMDHLEAGVEDDSGMSTYDRDADIVMGHECCAEVVDYGPGTERRIPVGTRVSSLPVLATATGRRIIGQNPESPGGFGEYFLLDESLTRVAVSELPSEIVCIADAISVGWSAASRRETALAMGADVVIDPAELSPYQAWRDVAHGTPEPMREMLSAAGLPGCVVFECVGLPGVLDSIIRGCERGTRIFSMGGPPEGEHLHTLTAKRKGLNIQFGGGPLTHHWDEAFEAVCSGSLDVAPMLGRTVGLDGVADALSASRDADGPVRIVVVP